MKSLLSVTDKHGNLIADQIQVADSFFGRLLGLMFRPGLRRGHGLLIYPCTSIHMMFMRFPIDAVFLDSQNRIVHTYQDLQPWVGLSSWHRDAAKVLELNAGTLAAFRLQPGDQLNLIERIQQCSFQ